MSYNRFPLARELGDICRKKKIKIAVAESCTGGSVSEIITSVPNSSQWFEAGFITYSNEAKTKMLGVDKQLIDKYGAVSEQVARAMAKGVLDNINVDFAVSITGVAGPGGGTVDKPVGTVWFAMIDKSSNICKEKLQVFSGGRKHIRRCASAFALEWFLEAVSLF